MELAKLTGPCDLRFNLPFCQKARTAAQADPTVTHVVGDHIRRAIAVAAECALEISAGVVEDIAAAPIDEFEQSEYRVAEAKPVADRLVDLFRAGDAFFHHACRLVHGERLDARHDEAGRRGTHHRHLADAFQQHFDTRDDIRIRGLAR